MDIFECCDKDKKSAFVSHLQKRLTGCFVTRFSEFILRFCDTFLDEVHFTTFFSIFLFGDMP